jgi:hypothetical protein
MGFRTVGPKAVGHDRKGGKPQAEEQREGQGFVHGAASERDVVVEGLRGRRGRSRRYRCSARGPRETMIGEPRVTARHPDEICVAV